jgi:hypothetical protein
MKKAGNAGAFPVFALWLRSDVAVNTEVAAG